MEVRWRIPLGYCWLLLGSRGVAARFTPSQKALERGECEKLAALRASASYWLGQPEEWLYSPVRVGTSCMRCAWIYTGYERPVHASLRVPLLVWWWARLWWARLWLEALWWGTLHGDH